MIDKTQLTKAELARLGSSEFGRMGGRSGTGASKRRSPAQIRKAVKARIKANKLRKENEAQEATA